MMIAMGRLVDTDDVMKRSKITMLNFEKRFPNGAIFYSDILAAFLKKSLEATPKPRIKQRKYKMRKRR